MSMMYSGRLMGHLDKELVTSCQSDFKPKGKLKKNIWRDSAAGHHPKEWLADSSDFDFGTGSNSRRFEFGKRRAVNA